MNINPNTLALEMCQLENFLLWKRWEQPKIRPVKDFSEEQLREFIEALYALTIDCWYLHNRQDSQPFKAYDFCDTHEIADRKEMISFTRQLLFCCDLDHLMGYRYLSLA